MTHTKTRFRVKLDGNFTDNHYVTRFLKNAGGKYHSYGIASKAYSKTFWSLQNRAKVEKMLEEIKLNSGKSLEHLVIEEYPVAN